MLLRTVGRESSKTISEAQVERPGGTTEYEMADINGFFNRTTIRDTRGTTNNSVRGAGNTVSFIGDSGRNSFDIGGSMNNVDVNNLGRDDRVNLQGPGWQELADGNSKDGVLRFYNSLSGSYAEVSTDGGRNDEFVRRRVTGANSSIGDNWAQMGNAASFGYMNGYLDGLRANSAQSQYNFGFQMGSWLSQMALGPFAWAL